MLCEFFKSSNDNEYSPYDFHEKFVKKHSIFKGYNQQDTQEFCRILLEDMSKELNEVEKPEPYKELSTFKKSRKICDKIFNESFKKRENSLVMDTFYGQLINIFICKCKGETYSFQKILDLPLLLPDSSDTSVKYLLEEYFKEDSIEFVTNCEYCGKKEEHIKQIKLNK